MSLLRKVIDSEIPVALKVINYLVFFYKDEDLGMQEQI